MKEKIKYIPILYLIFITIWLRLVNLGYSDYQGDEIKALFLPASGQGLFDFLLHQRKGPTQFIITYLVYLLHPSYSNESLTRSPFALVGILTIYFFYRLVKLHYGRTVALYASLFLTVNGLFIGLMRIVQYQPFVMFFSILALYAFSLALLNENWQIKGMYLGMLFWAIALLTHYDGIYISPFILYLLYRWYSQRTYLSSRTKVKHLVLPFAGLVLLLVSYYGPFFLSAAKDSQAYWLSRATGLDQSAKSSSMVTFRIYNPLFVIYIYLALGILSLVKIKKSFPIVLWFLFPWIILEVIISDPGTHIYGYLIPATILNAFGVVFIGEIITKILGHKYGSILKNAGLTVVFVLLFFLSHILFINHTPEFPWEEKSLLFWTIKKPNRNYKLWIFGFPYYRHWEEIGGFISSNEYNGYYSTNEKQTISNFYLPHTFNIDKSGYYIHIINPQSLNDKFSKGKIRYWTKHYKPIKIFENEDVIVAKVYKMPEGSLNEIKEAGY